MRATLVVLSAALAAAALPAQDVISLNFRGSTGRAVTGTAGVVPAASWNNVSGGSRTNPLVLLNDLGASSGASVTFGSASSGYRLNPPGTSQDAALYDGQIIETQSGGPAAIQLTGIPYSLFDLYVYVGHGPAHAGNDVRIDDGSTTYRYRNENLATYSDPIVFRRVLTTALPGALGNYVRFDSASATSVTLTLQAEPGGGSPGSSGIAGLQIVSVFNDTDGDGLDDGWELLHFGNLSQTATGDPDGDQLDNLGEFQRGTDPNDPDSDDDLALDGPEVQNGTDPLDPDSDDDRLQDGVETNTGTFVNAGNTGTDPLRLDTDGDRVNDGAEVRRGSDPTDPQSLPDLPNVIVIMVDDLGWGELGSYGQTRILTPELDQLAAQGMRFTQFYSGSPVCAPSRSTLVSGQHTGHCYVRNNGGVPLPAGTRTIGHVMRDEGYTTACIGKWGLGLEGSTGEPNSQGFDHFFGYLSQVNAHWFYPSFLWRNRQQVLYPTNNGVRGPANAGTVHSQDEMTREALQFIDQNRNNPFFLYLAWTIPHVSIQEPPHSDPTLAAQGQTAIDEFYPNVTWSEPNANFSSNHYTSHGQPRRGYAAMITAMDRDVGLLMAKLRQHGLDNDTLVLFTSDNGTTYCCGVDRQFFNSLAGLRGYKGEVWEGGLRVPAIARWPGQIAPGTTTDHVAGLWDILPTVTEAVVAPTPEDVDGVSFLPTLLGNPACQEQHDHLYWEYTQGGTRKKAVRMGDWKGVRLGDAAAGTPVQLFNLRTDPAETANVAAQNPAIVAAIERAMASRHTLSREFFRGRDEFPTIVNASISNVSPGMELNANSGATGYALEPLARDVATAVALPFQVQLQNVSGRSANGALLLGTSGNLIRFQVDGQQTRYRIVHGSDLFEVPFAPGTDPYRLFRLTAAYDPATGTASLADAGTMVVSGTLSTPLRALTHVGYRVDDARTSFRPVDPALGSLAPWRGSYGSIGSGCPGTTGVPLLRAALGDWPRLGACFVTEVLALPPGAGNLPFGVLGFSDTSWRSVSLPAGLGGLGMPGCTQYVSADAVVLLANQGGAATWSLPVPDQIHLLGLRFFQQAFVLDPGANAAGIAVSNAGAGVLGVR